MVVNDENVSLDSPAVIVDGRTLVPVRAISEAFNIATRWLPSIRTVALRTQEFIDKAEENKYTHIYDALKKIGTTSDGKSYMYLDQSRIQYDELLSISSDGNNLQIISVVSNASVALSISNDNSDSVIVVTDSDKRMFNGYYPKSTKALVQFPYVKSSMDIYDAKKHITTNLVKADDIIDLLTGCRLSEFGVHYYY